MTDAHTVHLFVLPQYNPCGEASTCCRPVGLFKAMQVAAGLALPKDISITLTQD